MSNVLDVNRREIKYRVSLEETAKVQRFMGRILPGDPHNVPGGYLVRSLYFDSLSNDDFAEKGDGLENRRKIRLRVYSPNDATAKLELKEKQGVWQHKRSLTFPRNQALRIAEGDLSPLVSSEAPLAQQLYRFMSERLYRPKCIVQYYRYAFVVPTNDIRITFDGRLMASEGCLDLYGDSGSLYPVGEMEDVTLEVKYNHFMLSYVKDILDSIDKVPVSYSKYVMSRFMTCNIE